jgi:ABC-type sugar transport system substrate-binding protein
MRHILIGVLLLSLSIPLAARTEPLHFALLLAQNEQDPFWGAVGSFAKQAGEQLGVKISIVHTLNTNRNMLQFIAKAKDINADAVIFPNLDQVGLHLLKDAERQQIPALLFNSDLSTRDKLITGKPQEKLKYWLASLIPDDQQAGYLLGAALIKRAKLQKLVDKHGVVQIIAINGALISSPARQRLAGLQQAIDEDEKSHLLRSVDTNWRAASAANKARRLSQHYPDANVYWAASDTIAIAIEKALKEQNEVQNVNYVTGGVDWSNEGLAAIQKNTITTSAGGHFMDGAWAIIMLYDHFNGRPIEANASFEFSSPMSLISEADISLLLPRLRANNWQDINFKRRSKVFNPQLSNYDFSPKSVLEELRKAQHGSPVTSQ